MSGSTTNNTSNTTSNSTSNSTPTLSFATAETNLLSFINNELNSVANVVSEVYTSFFNSLSNISISSLFNLSGIANTVDSFQRYFGVPNAVTAINPANINAPPGIPLPGPEHSYLGGTQINRLATSTNNELTVIAQREGTRETNIPMALSTSFWHEPSSSYNSAYPHNHVYATRGGLVQEFDDTPNAVRYHLYHPSGSYKEIDNNGTHATKATGTNFEIYEQDDNIYIKGSRNVTIEGADTIYVKNSCYVQVDGSLQAQVKNDLTAVVSGNVVVNATDNMIIKANTIQMECNNFNLIVGNTTTVQTPNLGIVTVTSVITGSEKFDVQSPKITLDAGDLYFNNSTIHSYFGIKVEDIDSHGDTGESYLYFLNVQDQNADKVTVPMQVEAVPLVAPIAPKAFPSLPVFGDDPVNNKQAITAISNDDAPQGYVVPNAGITQPPSYLGINTTSTPVPVSGTPTPLTAVDASDVINGINIPGSTVLSQHMTLASMSTDTAVSHYKVIPQDGLTEGQIVANLKYLSVNVVDPIINKYGKGNVVITSAFRLNATDSYVSQHQKGQAVDIQFKDIPKSQYAARAAEIAGFLNHDQLLFEYVWNGSNYTAWVHISLVNTGNNRQQYATIDVSNNKFTNGVIYNPFDNSQIAVANTAPTDGLIAPSPTLA